MQQPLGLRLTWPSLEIQQALNEVELFDLWLERQLERSLLEAHGDAGSLEALCSQWFGDAAGSLFLQRRYSLERVQLSVLGLSDPHLAQEFWFRLQAGEAEMEELASQVVTEEHAWANEPGLSGRVGPVPLSDLDPRLVTLLQGCRPGELAGPVAQGDGSVLLVRLEQRWPAQLDDATRRALERELYLQWRDQQVQVLLQAPPSPGSPVLLPLPTQP